MNLIEKNIRPRDICTREAFENAAIVVAATGGSTNGGLHLPAMAHEAGISFTLDDCVNIMRKTPYLADLRPGGKYVAKQMGEAGGVPMLLKTLLDAGLLHGDCMTVTGKTLRENLKDVTLAHRPGRHPPGLQSALAKPAAWSASGARSRPTAPS